MIFKWHPNLPIITCIWENEIVGFFRIKHDTKKWMYNSALAEPIKENKDEDSNDSLDSSLDESIDKNKLNLKIIHMNWLNEGNNY